MLITPSPYQKITLIRSKLKAPVPDATFSHQAQVLFYASVHPEPLFRKQLEAIAQIITCVAFIT